MSNRNERRRSSIFKRARDSFLRSRGARGADVDTLRGNTGADFESEAIVTRGNTGRGLFSCFGWTKDSKNKMKYLVLKGPYIFVFSKATSPSPKFAIPLKHEIVNVHRSTKNSQTVTLETGLGDIVYSFTFNVGENTEIGKNFGSILEEQIAVGNNEAAKKKLGHRLSFGRSKSLRYAHSIGSKKEGDQPDAPITTADAIADFNYASVQPY